MQQEQTTDIPFAGGATIFLDTGTGTFSLGTAFLWTSGTSEKWARWEGRWERILKCNICNCLPHNAFYWVKTNNNFESTRWNLRQYSSLWEDTTYANMYRQTVGHINQLRNWFIPLIPGASLGAAGAFGSGTTLLCFSGTWKDYNT